MTMVPPISLINIALVAIAVKAATFAERSCGKSAPRLDSDINTVIVRLRFINLEREHFHCIHQPQRLVAPAADNGRALFHQLARGVTTGLDKRRIGVRKVTGVVNVREQGLPTRGLVFALGDGLVFFTVLKSFPTPCCFGSMLVCRVPGPHAAGSVGPVG